MPHYSLSSSRPGLARLRRDVVAWGEGQPIDVGALALVVTELATNAVAASNQHDDVEVVVEVHGTHVEVVVTDQGPGFGSEPTTFDDVTLPSDPSSPGGRGLYLVRQLSDQLRAERQGGRTVVTARLRRLS